MFKVEIETNIHFLQLLKDRVNEHFKKFLKKEMHTFPDEPDFGMHIEIYVKKKPDKFNVFLKRLHIQIATGF